MNQKTKKPAWVVQKERSEKEQRNERVWIFGIHAVADALRNEKREKFRLLVTKNAFDKLQAEIEASEIEVDLRDARHFHPPIEAGSVHQGAVLEAKPLSWGRLEEVCAIKSDTQFLIMLDRVSDPHNVGAILRSAEVFGACAVVAPYRYAAPETGALAKSASGALERQPYVQVQNLARAMSLLKSMGYIMIGLDGAAEDTLQEVFSQKARGPIALLLGSEGPGLRKLTRENCDVIAKISSWGEFGSLNVSNAAAISAYLARMRGEPERET